MFKSLLGNRDPDADLVAAARRGDARAFDQIVLRHEAALGRFVTARLNSALDPADVVQETFVAAWQQLGTFRGKCRFKSWLFGIALNLSANAARRDRVIRERWVPLEGEGSVEPPPQESGVLRDAVEFADLRDRLAEQPDPGRQVLELYYYGDLNLREISELLGVNLSTLKYWFYQAHQRLRAALAAEERRAASGLAETRR